MYYPRLFSLFNTLSKPERRELGKYIQASFVKCNNRSRIKTLYTYLCKVNFDRLDVNLAKLYQRLYKEEYDSVKMRSLMSEFVRLIDDFFVLKEVQKRTDLRDALILEAYQSRQLDKQFEQKANKIKEALEKKQTKDPKDYYNSWELATKIYLHPSTEMKQKEEVLEKAFEDLDSFWLLNRMRYLCEVTLLRGHQNSKIQSPRQEEMSKIGQQEPFANLDLWKIYQKANVIFSSRKTSREVYRELEYLIENHLETASPKTRLELVALLINAINYVADADHREQEIFDLYQKALQSGWLWAYGFLDAGHFNNIVDVACATKRFEWTRAFVTDYIERISVGEDAIEKLKQLFNARILFAEAKYRTAVTLLQDLTFKTIHYGMRKYTLLIRGYYSLYRETKNYAILDDLEKVCSNYKVYLGRKADQSKLSKEVARRHKAFIKLVERMPNCGTGFPNSHTEEELLQMLNKMEPVALSSWLRAEIQKI